MQQWKMKHIPRLPNTGRADGKRHPLRRTQAAMHALAHVSMAEHGTTDHNMLYTASSVAITAMLNDMWHGNLATSTKIWAYATYKIKYTKHVHLAHALTNVILGQPCMHAWERRALMYNC